MKKQAASNFLRRTRKKRPRKHSKKSSKLKTSQLYTKLNRGQG